MSQGMPLVNPAQQWWEADNADANSLPGIPVEPKETSLREKAHVLDQEAERWDFSSPIVASNSTTDTSVPTSSFKLEPVNPLATQMKILLVFVVIAVVCVSSYGLIAWHHRNLISNVKDSSEVVADRTTRVNEDDLIRRIKKRVSDALSQRLVQARDEAMKLLAESAGKVDDESTRIRLQDSVQPAVKVADMNVDEMNAEIDNIKKACAAVRASMDKKRSTEMKQAETLAPPAESSQVRRQEYPQYQAPAAPAPAAPAPAPAPAEPAAPAPMPSWTVPAPSQPSLPDRLPGM